MYWNWKKSAIALASCFLVAVVLVKPIGVSTQFVIVDGIIANGIAASVFGQSLVTESSQAKSGYASSNAYLNKSGGKYAKAIANPLSYGLVFVVAMVFGGFIASRTQQRRSPALPVFHRNRFGNSEPRRYFLAFAGGVIVLFGARLAGGCTSGHMMSGMMQTALSGYVFAASAFAAAIPVAILMYRRGAQP